MNDADYHRLFSSGGATPKMYGLSKIHKEPCPLRSIVSFNASLTYNLSRFLVDLLAPVTGKNGFTIRNSPEFVMLMREQAFQENDGIVSFDVVSLFTNVPTQLAVEAARSNLQQDYSLDLRRTLTVDDTVLMLWFCLTQTYF